MRERERLRAAAKAAMALPTQWPESYDERSRLPKGIRDLLIQDGDTDKWKIIVRPKILLAALKP